MASIPQMLLLKQAEIAKTFHFILKNEPSMLGNSQGGMQRTVAPQDSKIAEE